MKKFIVLTFALLLAGAVSLRAADAKENWDKNCAKCHGEDGKGQTAKGKKLKLKDIRAADVQKMTPAQWTDVIMKGSGQDMDAYGKELGADMSRKLADYMRELSKTK